MISQVYKIAGKNIKINSIYQDVHDYCKEYISIGNVDFKVTTTLEDIKNEQKNSDEENILENKKIIKYSEGYLEELAVYRKIVEKLIDYNTILLHGSVISIDGEGFLFTAKSGTGKSTHTKLWREFLGEKAIMVNDDKPLLKIEENVIVYGTPYTGKHGIGYNINVPLKAICILNRGEKNTIKEIDQNEVYTKLIQQVYKPNEIKKIEKTIKLVNELLKKVKFYSLECNMNIEAAKIAYEGMK